MRVLGSGLRAVDRVQQERRGDLIVAAATRVQQLTRHAGELTDARIDCPVHVFKGLRARIVCETAVANLHTDRGERPRQFRRLRLADDLSAAQRLHVSARTFDVKGRQDEILFERRAEGEQLRVGRRAEAAAPLQRAHSNTDGCTFARQRTLRAARLAG